MRATFLKSYYNTGVFKQNLQKVSEHLFYRTPPVAAFELSKLHSTFLRIK